MFSQGLSGDAEYLIRGHSVLYGLESWSGVVGWSHGLEYLSGFLQWSLGGKFLDWKDWKESSFQTTQWQLKFYRIQRFILIWV